MVAETGIDEQILTESVASILGDLRAELATLALPPSDVGLLEDEEERPDYLDIRLRLQADGSFDVLSGDASYDTDHRGYWGASSINSDTAKTELHGIAADLVDQAIDDLFESLS